jgi:hypothetical protein
MLRKCGVTLVAILMLVLGMAGDLFAFRCGSGLVEKGDRKIEVLKKCGEPASVDEWEAIRRTPASRFGLRTSGLEKVRVEEWTYNFGPQRFLQIYQFENGQVVEMKFGDYGF